MSAGRGARVLVALSLCGLVVVPAAAEPSTVATATTARAAAALPPGVAYQAWGSARNLEAIADGNAATAAVVDSGPARIFLLLGEESLLSAILVTTAGRLGVPVVELSQDALSWTPVVVRVRRDARRGETRLEFAEPMTARAVMLTLPYSGRSLSLKEVRLEPAAPATPRVREIVIGAITEDAATVTWKTDRPAKTLLLYGFRPDGMKNFGDPSYELRRDHNVRLTGLLPGTDYRAWIVIGRDSAIGASPGQPLRFRTAGTPLPFATGFRHALGRDTAQVRFLVNIPARAVLEWREQGTENVRRQPVLAGDALLTDHAALLAGLQPRVTYEYQVIATDSRGRSTATPWIAFATEPYNLAAGRPASGTFQELLDEQASGDTRPALERVTDGRDDYFHGMATSGDPGETDQWVEVDLGEPSRIATVEMVWRGNAYPRSYYVMTSLDRQNWAYPGFGLDAGAGAFERSSGGDPLRRVSLAIEATDPVRYVRVFIPRGSDYFVKTRSWRFVQLAELEAHGHWAR